jgi:hypothetical protein
MKILVFSQHLYPMQTPRAFRTTELIKELARQGHTVTVYAVLGKTNYESFEKEHGIKVKHIPLRYLWHSYTSDNDKKRFLIDKILGKLLGKIAEFPNIEFYYRLKKIIKREKETDVIISIADPHQIHWGVARAKKKLDKRFSSTWIADCGDPFMENNTTKDHYKYFAKFEHLFCKLCDYITVPDELARDGYYEEYRHKIRVIPQGFDFDLSNINNSIPDNKIVQFAYAGLLHAEYRNPQLFLNELASLPYDFNFHVYTADATLVEPYRKLLEGRLIIHETIPREELHKELARMDFVVNIENNNLPSQLPSKLIDYSILDKPILSINPSDPSRSKIEKFINKDYSQQLIIEDLSRFHIKNVCAQFVQLFTAEK